MKLKEAVYIELNRQIVRINQRHNPQRTFPLILLLVIPNLIGTHCISFLIDVVCDTRCFQKQGTWKTIWRLLTELLESTKSPSINTNK